MQPKLNFLVRPLAVLMLFCEAFALAEVRVWEDTLALPVYEEGMPDPNPPFDQFAVSRFNYPYTLRTNLTDRRVVHNVRAIYLENEYLKCSVLPDVGGHLYTCTDKISGKPMFYANPSIKKAAIGYRGVWAAFGIEFNFPVSHNWVSMSPVNFAFAKHEDGSASVTVGNIDRVYGMEWAVELALQPKSTVLEQKVTLSNRSDVRHRFYWWNNAGVEVWDDSRIEYPMRFAASHGFTDVYPWPVTQGKDLSVIHNQTDGPVSLFVHGSREPFMGVWNPHTNTGTAHFAEYAELPAKKIWSWGADADALDWRKALSDNNSAYVEIQAGLFRNQETYGFLEPRQSVHFSEFWMPVREIGGISRANLTGVVNLSRRSNALIAGFNANRAISHAGISILDGNQRLLTETVDLVPDRTWLREVQVPDPQRRYTFELRDASGATLQRHTEGEYDWSPQSEIHVGPQPSYRTSAPDKRSEDDWIELGKEKELNGDKLKGLDTYKDALARFPNSFAAQKAAGRLASSLLRFEEAKSFLEPVRSRDTSDTEISYYLGIAYDGLGDVPHARAAYEEALRLPEFRAAAAVRLAELLARGGDLQRAEHYLQEVLRVTPDDVRAVEEQVAILDALGKSAESRALAEQSLQPFPLSNFLHEELGNPDLRHLANDVDRLLEIAGEYMRLGLYQRALTVLSRDYPRPTADESEPGSLELPSHPLLAYFTGYCKEKLGQSGIADYERASKLPTAYVFPSSAEALTVLQAALRAYPEDASAHYLLGTLYFSRGLTDLALSEWSKARATNPDIPVLDADLGLALLRVKNDPAGALAAFREGVSTDPTNVVNYIGIDQTLSILNRPAQERVEALQKYPRQNDMPSELIFELILNLLEAGDYQRAEALFHDRFFPREEGGVNVRQVWIEVQLQHAISLAKKGRCTEAISSAQHLGSRVSGLAFTNDGLEPYLNSARTNYLLGTVDSSCSKPAEARTHFETALKASSADQAVWSWLAAQQLSDSDLQQWRTRLGTALSKLEELNETGSPTSWSLYLTGLLQKSLGREQEADATLQRALSLAPQMLAYHFIRQARSGSIQ